jgi:transcriptional regulator with XRE-family HTH domain
LRSGWFIGFHLYQIGKDLQVFRFPQWKRQNYQSADILAIMANRVKPKRPTKLYIDEWRTIRGLSVDDLAHRMRVSYATVSRWISEDRHPDAPTLKAIAESLDIDVPDLFRRPEQAHPGALLQGLSDEDRAKVLDYIDLLRRRNEKAP